MHAPTEDARAVELLRELGAAELEHPGGTLLAHLERVRAKLVQWEARPALQLAGLCHAFYGTDGFATALHPVERRSELAAVIGNEAESLVYFYASCDREASYPTLAEDDAVFHDRFTGETFTPSLSRRREFAELTVANELDIARINAEFRAKRGPDLLALFTGFRPLLSEQAWGECRTVLSHRG
ncbi:DUF6817 domain-containing protein [Streptomyces sp. H27-D2]|uniref:DUF6817 domain-containing protein n=1 Tax=Streptomyces sp. H27-D2 TaxID=3046304 RepID=UPI002DBC49ED|nr:hypothetical protein [Streptomyces sp. H27-D2]MEC4015257.1 hypothetical protein [Streptomyces sp. H27-D2]